MLTKDQIKSVASDAVVSVRINALGGEIGIRRLMMDELLGITATAGQKMDGEGAQLFGKRLIQATVCDENGEALFESAEEVGKTLRADAVMEIAREAMRLNGLDQGAVKQAGEGSPPMA